MTRAEYPQWAATVWAAKQPPHCVDAACVCHTDRARVVRTPFPPLHPDDISTYCCSRCHSARRTLPDKPAPMPGETGAGL